MREEVHSSQITVHSCVGLGAGRLGVKGVINKSSDEKTFQLAIQAVGSGHYHFEHDIQINSTRQTDFNCLALRFTPREKETVVLLAQGLTSQQIANRLGLTLKTIETYRCRLLDKVGVRNTSELLHYVHTHGLFPEEAKATLDFTLN